MKFSAGRLGKHTLIAFGVVWAITVLIGILWLFEYQATASVMGNPVTCWPVDCGIVPTVGRAHLVMVPHPHCPCTRASIESLARVMAHCQKRTTAIVLFLKPKGAPFGWETTDLWRAAAAIPGVQVVCDNDGHKAACFGVQSSGHLLLFGRNGRRLFSGGITAGRGHHGDNTGLDHCIALINAEKTGQHDMPVFGCSLLDPPVGDVEGEAMCRQTKSIGN